MKLNDLDLAHVAAGRLLPARQSEPGWRRALVALKARLERTWVGFYAAPPRRLPPLV